MVLSNLTLIGMPGCGKSTLGVLLAKVLGWDFYDTDLALQIRSGKNLHTLMHQWGRERFLAAEAEVVGSLQVERTVVSTGGSLVYSEGAMQHLTSLGPVVWIDVDENELRTRVGDMSARGVVAAEGQDLGSLYRERRPLYFRWATHTLPVGSESLETTLGRLVQLLEPSLTPKSD